LPKPAFPHHAHCKSRVKPLIAASILALLAGCAVGPNFKRPAAPEVSDYVPTPLSTTTSTPNTVAGEPQRFADGAEIAADWWTMFHSAPLNELIDRSLSSNHDLKAAQAALTVAKENMLAQRGAYFPSVSANLDATRQRQSGQISPVLNSNTFLYNLFTPQVSVSYVPDVFGLNRRTVESLQAQEQEARFQMIATYTTLTSNVVVAAIQVGATQMQIDATHELIDSAEKTLKILRFQLDKGYAGGLDVAAVESQLAQFAATLPPLIKQEAQLRDQLAVLAGRFPSQAPAINFDLATLQLPQDLPVSLPSALVSQRPDVLQAEANLHDASAKIGIAIANRLPNIVLTANAGSSAAEMSQLFTTGTGFWGIGASLTAPIFQGGMLLHQERAAKAAYEVADAQYRNTVLTAFQNVADALRALQLDAATLRAQQHSVRVASETFDLTRGQYRLGAITYVVLLNAQRSYQQARLALVTAQAARFADTAALFAALGGGWWNRVDVKPDPFSPEPMLVHAASDSPPPIKMEPNK
jgi:NodT family efflux transporter outer membrane factor (OMF) lipoprotein